MILKEWQCPRCNTVNSKPDYVLRLARLRESLGLIGIGTSTEPAPRCSQCDYEAGINALLDGKYDTRDEKIPAPASKKIEKPLAAPLDKPAKTDRLALIVVGVIAAVLVCGICAWSIGGGIYLSRISGKEFPSAFLTSTSTLTPTPVPTQTPPFTPTLTPASTSTPILSPADWELVYQIRQAITVTKPEIIRNQTHIPVVIFANGAEASVAGGKLATFGTAIFFSHRLDPLKVMGTADDTVYVSGRGAVVLNGQTVYVFGLSFPDSSQSGALPCSDSLLTPEECANSGTHFYYFTTEFNCSTPSPISEKFTITFSDTTVEIQRTVPVDQSWVYQYTEVSANIYVTDMQNPMGGLTHVKIEFNDNGFTMISSDTQDTCGKYIRTIAP